MHNRSIPAPILAAVSAMLGPYLDDPSPSAIVAALKREPAPADPGARRMLTLRQAATALDVSMWTVRRHVLAGKIPARKIGSQWRVPVAAVEALAALPEAEA